MATAFSDTERDAPDDPRAAIDAAARRAWGALLIYFLRVALAERERRG